MKFRGETFWKEGENHETYTKKNRGLPLVPSALLLESTSQIWGSPGGRPPMGPGTQIIWRCCFPLWSH